MITLTVKPIGLGSKGQIWEASIVGGMTVVATSREPFFAAARALLKRGAKPTQTLAMKHAGSDTISLQTTVGHAASLTVKERDRTGLSFERFEERPDLSRRARPPERFDGQQVG